MSVRENTRVRVFCSQQQQPVEVAAVPFQRVQQLTAEQIESVPPCMQE